jgi:hypothetical protein
MLLSSGTLDLPALAVDGGELNHWRDSAQGWWLGAGSFSVSNATEPWLGARGAVSNGSSAILAFTNGIYAFRFNGSSTFIDIPSQPRFNLSAVSDPSTLLCNDGSLSTGMQGLCSDGTLFYWYNQSLVLVFDASSTLHTNYAITCGHGNDAAWWGASDNPMGTNVILWCGGNSSGPTNGMLYAWTSNGVASGTWDLGNGSTLTNVQSVAHIASNQFVVTQYDSAATQQRLACVYLGAAGAYTVGWISNLPVSVGLYAQGSAGTNGHAYVLYDLNANDKTDTACIYDFAISPTGYAYNGLMLCGVPTQTENDGLTWYNGTLVIGDNNVSATGAIRQTSWPMRVKHGFTLSAWATKESNSGNLELISKFNSVTGGRSWTLMNINGQIASYLRGTNELYIFQGSSSGTVGGTNFPFYTWHNYTLTFDGLNLTAYTDGYMAFSEPPAPSYTTAIAMASPTDVLIGSIVGSQFWQGFMKDVRIWNRPLSATEVKKLYLEGP